MAFHILLEHAWHENPNAMDDTPDIYAEGPLPILFRLFPNRTAGRHSGVVTENMHAAKRIEGFIGERLDIAPFGDIGSHGQYAMARVLEFFFGPVQCVFFDIRKHDLHAFARKTQSHGTA